MLLTVFPDLGLSSFVIREIAKDSNTGMRWFGRLFVFRLCALGVLLVGTFGLCFFLWRHSDLGMTVAALTLAYGLFALSDTFLDIFRGHEEMHWPALLGVFFKLVAALLGGMALWRGDGLAGVLKAYVVAGCMSLIFSVLLTLRIHGRMEIEQSWRVPGKVLAKALPFAAPRIIGIVNTRLGVYVLGFFVSMETIGVFGASLRLVEGVLFIPALIAASVFPNFVRLSHISDDALATGATATFKLLMAIILPVAVGCCFFSEQIILLVYGDTYLAAAPLLAIHIWMGVFFFANSLFATVLQATYRQKTLALLAATSLGIHAAFAVILIPLKGSTGAAYAAVCPEIIMLVVCLSLYTRCLRLKRLWRGLMKVMTATLIVSVGLGLARAQAILPVMVFAVTGYLALLAALNPFDGREITWIKSSLYSRQGH